MGKGGVGTHDHEEETKENHKHGENDAENSLHSLFFICVLVVPTDSRKGQCSIHKTRNNEHEGGATNSTVDAEDNVQLGENNSNEHGDDKHNHGNESLVDVL